MKKIQTFPKSTFHHLDIVRHPLKIELTFLIETEVFIVAKQSFIHITIFILLLLFFTLPAHAQTINVTTLGADGSDTVNDKKAIQEALDTPSGDHLTVYLPAGTYYISGPLYIHSNTTLHLDKDACIKRNAAGLEHNMLKNADADHKTDLTGSYDLSTNITIEGGTWDGGDIANATSARNLINIGHANHVVIQNTTIRNCFGSHLIEFAGVSDSQIRNCTLTGFRYRGSLLDSEAIQLDVCHSDEDGSWNPAFLADDTFCQNIIISNNTIRDYPRGVGNHHALDGKHNLNITIQNNTFVNTTSLGRHAINLAGFDNTIVQNNSIQGYGWGVRAYSCNVVSLIHNNLKNCSEVGISLSDFMNSVIRSNTIDTTNRHGILINGYSSLSDISSNRISNTGAHGIIIDESVCIQNITGNKLSQIGQNRQATGIVVCSKNAYITSIAKNTIQTSSLNGISISENATIKNISQNTVSKCKLYGIVIDCPKKKTTISKNKISATNNSAILLCGKSKASLSKNRISSIYYSRCVRSEKKKITEGSIRTKITKKKKRCPVLHIYCRGARKITIRIGKSSYTLRPAKKKELSKKDKRLKTNEVIYLLPINTGKRSATITMKDRYGNIYTMKQFLRK